LQLFSVSPIEDCHFETTEVIEAELQALLNTLIEHDFLDAFNNWQKHWEWCICAEGDCFEHEGGQQAHS
jgi:hypothetical protein